MRLPLHSGLVEQLAAAIQAPGFVARQQVPAGLFSCNCCKWSSLAIEPGMCC